MNYVLWRRELAKDAENLELLLLMMNDITPAHDSKLQTLFQLLDDKIAHPINPGNRKVIIFRHLRTRQTTCTIRSAPV